MPSKDVPYLEFFKRLKGIADIVVSAKRLRPFKALDASPDPHAVTRARMAYTEKDLRIAESKVYTGVCSGADMSEHLLECLGAMKLVEPVLFNVAASEWGVQLDPLSIIEEAAIDCDLPWMLVKDKS